MHQFDITYSVRPDINSTDVIYKDTERVEAADSGEACMDLIARLSSPAYWIEIEGIKS